MKTTPIEEQLRRYGRDLAERDRSGGLFEEPAELTTERGPSAGVDSGAAADVRPRLYVPASEGTPTERRWQRRAMAVAAAAVVVVALVAGALLRHRGDTARTEDPLASTTTTLGVAAGPVGPYALPPTDAESVEGLVDADLYAIRYVAAGRQFLLVRNAMGLPPTSAMTERDLRTFLGGRGEETQVPSLGTVHITCGDGGQLTDDGTWSWWSAAVGYWIQDGYVMSLNLVGTGESPQIAFDQDGNAVSGGHMDPVPCPEGPDGDTLRDALSSIRTVDRTELDSTLDSMPLTIGTYGRDIAQPR